MSRKSYLMESEEHEKMQYNLAISRLLYWWGVLVYIAADLTTRHKNLFLSRYLRNYRMAERRQDGCMF